LNLNEKVAIITGAAGNLGKAVAKRFIDAGTNVILFDHKEGRLQADFKDQAGSSKVKFIEAVDLTDADQVSEGVTRAYDCYARLDILVNTVGGYQAGQPVHETEISTWDAMMTLNAKTVFLMCRAVVPYLLEQNYGKIVNVSARPGLGGKAKMSAYSASKSAVIRLTESLSAELKQVGINVNCVLPGTIDTPENREAIPNADFSKWVDPDKIARVIQFLCSDDAESVQGGAVPVTGKS